MARILNRKVDKVVTDLLQRFLRRWQYRCEDWADSLAWRYPQPIDDPVLRREVERLSGEIVARVAKSCPWTELADNKEFLPNKGETTRHLDCIGTEQCKASTETKQ